MLPPKLLTGEGYLVSIVAIGFCTGSVALETYQVNMLVTIDGSILVGREQF